MAADLKETLNLPKTDFPMRANLVQREPERIKHWQHTNVYQKMQEQRKGAPTFLLHDGPPFTNGDVHIGTALNKILKDIIVRYKYMRGYRTPYIPGWDCHGLPIEHKVTREQQANKNALDNIEIRRACAEFSESYIEHQQEQFQRLGVMGDWEHAYRTMDPEYEADILRTFAYFVESGLVYRSKKPVYWSIPCKTALAEAEVEYHNHTSPSIWVGFPVNEASRKKHQLPENTQIVIWTTTPWTIPSNLAIALHPRLEYRHVHSGDQVYVVAEELAEDFISQVGLESPEYGVICRGQDLEGIETTHPFIERTSPVVMAEYVTTESGTGCVHIAPGHGLEDYATGQQQGLPVYCPIDDEGCYVADADMPEALVGISVLETQGKCPANQKVLGLLKDCGSLLQVKTHEHQYPFCWRSKTPVIYRAMDQWFVSLDHEQMREKVIANLETVQWIPEWGKNRIHGAVTHRPDWCISRQRSWGVPLPAFYNEEGDACISADVIRGIADKVEKKGTDIWFTHDAEELLEGIRLPSDWSGPFTKGTDTLDVWIDSGCSHRAVLQKRQDLQWPADLYLEGSDQHRGWFQSSLWTSTIADGKAPYRAILTHGFIVDENKRKVSKSAEGKPQTADSYVNQYGADLIRLWVSSVDYANDVPVSDPILKQVTQSYRTIRNTLRFQIGNLYDFSAETDAVPYEELTPLDKWVLYETAQVVDRVTHAYDQYAFHKVYQLIHAYCNETLSATYHDILKDRLYTYAPHWPSRRSSQTAISYCFDILVRLLCPILSFTCDEAWSYAHSNSDFTESCLALQEWPTIPDQWRASQPATGLKDLFQFRNRVNEALESARQSKEIGQSLDAHVLIRVPTSSHEANLLREYESVLPEYFIVSQVSLFENTDYKEPEVTIEHAGGERCQRSWRWVPELVSHGQYHSISPRCREALIAIEEQNTKPV